MQELARTCWILRLVDCQSSFALHCRAPAYRQISCSRGAGKSTTPRLKWRPWKMVTDAVVSTFPTFLLFHLHGLQAPDVPKLQALACTVIPRAQINLLWRPMGSLKPWEAPTPKLLGPLRRHLAMSSYRALKIRIGFLGLFYYKYNREPPKEYR